MFETVVRGPKLATVATVWFLSYRDIADAVTAAGAEVAKMCLSAERCSCASTGEYGELPGSSQRSILRGKWDRTAVLNNPLMIKRRPVVGVLFCR